MYRSGLATALRAKYHVDSKDADDLTVVEEYKLEVHFKTHDAVKPLEKPSYNPETKEYELKHASQRCDIVILHKGTIVAILELKFAQKLCYSHAAQALGYARQCVRNGRKISPNVKLFIVNFYKDGTSGDSQLTEDYYEGQDICDRIGDWCHNDSVVLIENVFRAAGLEGPLPPPSLYKLKLSASKSSSNNRTPQTPASSIEPPARTPANTTPKTPSS